MSQHQLKTGTEENCPPIDDSSIIEFVNHASVRLSNGKTSILTDPWYFGDVFHQGWSLLAESTDSEISALLARTTHIWISHEHPDHFSPPFFKRYQDQIRARGIVILFQKTRDQRVANFLRNLQLTVIELPNNKSFKLGDGFSVRVVKSDLYDSALLAEINDIRVFNLNDCPIHSKEDLAAFAKEYGQCDLLLTQFSYAAWKGGRENTQWRKNAARQKLKAMHQQIQMLGANACILFASFVRFSNQMNSYMNDAINIPDRVAQEQVRSAARLVFMRPGETQPIDRLQQDPHSLAYWRNIYNSLAQQPLIEYQSTTSIQEISQLFQQYQEKIFNKNNAFLLRVARDFLPLHPFGKTNILLTDLGVTLKISVLDTISQQAANTSDVAMHSSSLAFLLQHEFGFDTLFVNGCFEETSSGGFERFAKCFALGSLNASGIFVTFGIVLQRATIAHMIKKLAAIRRNMAKNKR
jgi:UDP-MurNAc hydroxylase